MSYLISVIVPVYNVEKYLDRCLTSIVNQTYKNLEIILVDDGSPDNCPKLCDEWAKKDERIKVIHKHNGGLSSARNAGLKEAKGEYVGFVDSDDYINLNMYEVLMNELLKNNVDFCSCAWQYVFFNGYKPKVEGNLNNKILNIHFSLEFEKFNYLDSYSNGLVCGVWNKLYKKSIFNNLEFKNVMHEDEEINDRINCNSYKVIQIKDVLYNYCQNFDSITNQKFSKKKFDFLDILIQRRNLFYNDNFIQRETEKLYCELCVEYYLKAKKENIEIEKKYLKAFKVFYIDLIKYKYCNFKFYVRMNLFCISPSLYNIVLDFKNRLNLN